MNLRDKSIFYKLLQPRPIYTRQLPTFYNIVQQYYYLIDTNTHDFEVKKTASSIIEV